MKPLPTQARLHELFYCVNGVFYRKTLAPLQHNVSVGDRAGYKMKDGYFGLTVDGSMFKLHRLVWKYYYGTDPHNMIDHIDHNRTNNNIWNLRDVTASENQRNMRKTMLEHGGQHQRTTIDGKSVFTKYGNKVKWQRDKARLAQRRLDNLTE